MKKILTSSLSYPFVIVILCLVIAFKNYTPGTFLTGWDTLHPEFNFEVNFNRLIFGVWRSDQGLGDMSGHTQMADLPRLVILWLLHLVLPLSFLRYSYVFICLILGPLGFYYLIKYLFKSPLIAFLSALTYLLNLGTVQQFFVPFEMFPTQWAFLPWIFLFTLKYLYGTVSNRSLLIFSFLTLFSTPQSYAAHLWYPFFGLYSLFLIFHYLLTRHHLTKHLILFILTLTLNSFWLLPNLYYAATSSQIVKDNLNNRLHSQEFLLRNRETGVISDSALNRGFYFNWDVYNFATNSSEKLMPTWIDHTNKLDIEIIGNLFFFAAFVGLIAAIINRQPILIALSPIFFVSFTLLTNRTPFFSFFFNLLVKNSLLQEILRFVFTKFSILYQFSLCLFFSYFIYLIFSLYQSHRFKKYFSLGLIFSLIIYVYPIFQGQLISPAMRIDIPSDYFSFWKFMKSKPSGIVLTLPLHQSSGWQYYDWGYQGSGFIWFGSPQSFLDRDSDRWSRQNEQSYRQFSQALYSNDVKLFSRTLDKYNISYILRDLSNIPTSPKNRLQTTFKYETDDLLSQLIANNIISKVFSSNKLELYQLNLPPPLVAIQSSSTSYDNDFPLEKLLNQHNRLKASAIKTISSMTSTSINYDINTLRGSTTFSSYNSSQYFSIPLNGLTHQQPYLLAFNSTYHQGLPIRFCLKNTTTDLCLVEDELSKYSQGGWDYFIVPKSDNFEDYRLDIGAISFGYQPSSSTLTKVIVSPITLPSTSLDTPIPPEPINFNSIFPNNSLIKVSLTTTSADYLTLNQSFSPGWIAFYFDNYKIRFLPDHVTANTWANGWDVKNINKNVIYILFWPQLLEFVGFGLLFLTLIYTFRQARK